MTANATLRRRRGVPFKGVIAVLGLVIAAGVGMLIGTRDSNGSAATPTPASVSIVPEDFTGVDDFVASRVPLPAEPTLQEDFSGVDEHVAARKEAAMTTSVLQEDFTGLE